jgi:hypothetical protein
MPYIEIGSNNRGGVGQTNWAYEPVLPRPFKTFRPHFFGEKKDDMYKEAVEKLRGGFK